MWDLTKHISTQKFYLEMHSVKTQGENEEEWHCLCPFHKEKRQSFSINKLTGLWTCFGPCKTGGNMLQFHARTLGLTPADAEIDLKVTLGIEKCVPPEKVHDNHEKLLKAPQVLDFLQKRRGLFLETVKRFELGYDGERIWIPVKVGNHYLNVRRYAWKPGGEARDKMLSYDVGYGEARLFPADNLQHDVLLLNEGETDCILANQLGYNSITVTGGAGTWTQAFTEAVAGKTLIVCYDIDDAGKRGAAKVVKAVGRFVKEIKVIQLPITEPKNADFTDYIVNHGYTKKDFDKLIADTEAIQQKVGPDGPPLDPNVYKVSLNEASDKQYYMKQVKFPIIVSGKDLAPYFVPKKVKFTCGMGLKKCTACGLGPNGFGGDHTANITNPSDILQLIGVPESVQKNVLKQKVGIIPCNLPVIVIEEAQNVEEIRVIPEIEYSSKDSEYVTRDIFVIGHGVKTNASYTMQGITLPDPKTQYATQVITELEPNQLSIDQFKMSPELMEKLKVFQVAKDQTIQEKLADIYKDFTFNITKIYKREDMLQAIDLVYHSVLQFDFLGRTLTKGWTEALILGDTRCGKSESIERMINHYKAGELVTGENTSFAGLIGGMQQSQQRWSISWGKIPLNDRRLVAIDEVSGLPDEQISLMSSVRSSGIAEIVKIQAEKTHARTRLLWSSNPRSGRRLDTYNNGVLAIRELIGRVEDIARFDLAVTVASGEVSADCVFELKSVKVPHVYTSDLCNQLIMWAWSRSTKQVEIAEDVNDAVHTGVQELARKYSSVIPLVEPAEQRIKIIRLATALAVRLFSTLDGEVVIVRPDHVKEVVRFLKQVYDKPSMGYDLFSAAAQKVDQLNPEDLTAFLKEFKEFGNWEIIRDLLLESGNFRKSEIMDQLGLDKDDGRLLFQWLGKHRMIRATNVGFVKQPFFTQFLKSIKASAQNGNGSKTLATAGATKKAASPF